MKTSESSSKKPTAANPLGQRQTQPSAISKQVLKHNPIPQAVTSDTAVRGKATQPLRSTKVSQKLVLFPQPSTEAESTMQATLPVDSEILVPSTEEVESQEAYEQEVWREEHPPQVAAGVPLPVEWTFGSRTPAERMPKDERDYAGLPRVAAYCTGEGYALSRLRPFLREHHHAVPRLYDECLYTAYDFPLMTLRPDKDNLHNIRVRSASPRPAREEEMDFEEDHYRQESEITEHTQQQTEYQYPQHYEHTHIMDNSPYKDQQEETFYPQETTESTPLLESTNYDIAEQQEEKHVEDGTKSASAPTSPYTEERAPIPEPMSGQNHNLPPLIKPFEGGEVFIFDYGVVVFWNFRRAEELLMLEDLAPFSIRPFRDNPDEDMQIEEMHFQYDTSQLKPRIFNDMITLKTGNHMIKLTLSHGLSQSAVLARYEDLMDKTIEDTKHLPKEMAQTGRLDKNRTEITKINGELFNLRMNVNLVSNVLGHNRRATDTPEIFWSEPALQPMYNAIREYLEIPQRAKILNDRLRVISDLLSMLRDHLTNFGVEYQTLIIIYLIIVAVIVACFEIAVKVLQSIEVV
ncbi:hypothetical protein DFQ28_007535 [Apophysomyces sp. BC1034]|nr:hypothetical protein DFQ30_007495 [Apophysomyces sp. BC1015]KAG0182037.1 hypothetical protein DFQ29_006017 [Apophysomyces sp. BC1021]KAG0186616.1 hypothetical protein DFQ28_007535 [Apophysomyces sp. BC1034]